MNLTTADDIVLLVIFIYWILMDGSRYQASLGKKALGLRVVDAKGHRLSLPRALGRNLLKLLSWLTVFIGFMLARWTERKQALHDMITGCYVTVETRPGRNRPQQAARAESNARTDGKPPQFVPMQRKTLFLIAVGLIVTLWVGWFALHFPALKVFAKLRDTDLPVLSCHPIDENALGFLETVKGTWNIQSREEPDSIFAEISSVTGVDENVEGVVAFHTFQVPEFSFFDPRRNKEAAPW